MLGEDSMLEGKKVLALIPARGGSKGIPNKNIYEIKEKPLIAYTIECAKNSQYIDDVVVSTDSEVIARVAKEYGASVPFMRPEELASDTAKTIDGVLHALQCLVKEQYEILVLLQPTSPLRTTEDVDLALEKFASENFKSLVAVSEVNDSPILMRKIYPDGKMEKLLCENSTVRRQDMPMIYRVNGSIYINLVSEINEDTSFNDNSIPYVMEKNHSVDIDEYSDIVLAEWLLKNSI